MIGIYKITNPKGRVYIGQSRNIEKRISNYKGLHNCKTQPKLYRSFIKYGTSNHIFEIIEECDVSQINKKERYYQLVYNSITNGLNCDLAEDENCPRKRSKETREKISRFQKVRVMSKETREKISISRTGLIFSEEHRKNISLSKTGQLNKRSVLVLDTSVGVYYYSIAEAGKIYSIDHRTLSRYLNGTRKNKTNLISV